MTSMPASRSGVARVHADSAMPLRLRAHVEHLASQIGERRQGVAGSLDAAADYVAAAHRATGLPVRDAAYGDRGEIFRNIEAEIAGSEPAAPLLVIGAHYDSVPGSPGADDNASGVAALIELGRLLADRRMRRSLRLVAFANEEDPFWMTPASGSFAYARQARERGQPIRFMLSLEMVGYYDASPGSQRYPRLIGWRYPDSGDFLGVVGRLQEWRLVRRLVSTLRAASPVPAHGLVAPVRLVPDIRRSDHAAFWHFGYPAAMVTDTANFRYPFYHTAGDTPERLDYDRMAAVVAGLAEVLRVEANAPTR